MYMMRSRIGPLFCTYCPTRTTRLRPCWGEGPHEVFDTDYHFTLKMSESWIPVHIAYFDALRRLGLDVDTFSRLARIKNERNTLVHGCVKTTSEMSTAVYEFCVAKKLGTQVENALKRAIEIIERWRKE